MNTSATINVLVTGANGFIGGHLCRQLALQDDVKIYGFDLSEGRWSHPRFEFRKADIREPGFEASLPEHIDVVIHLAQSPRYREFPNGAEDMMKVNVQGTFRLLEWARKMNVKRFILASTGNVYAPSKEPLTEMHPCHANSFYAASKLCAEQFTEQYSNFFGVIVLRLFGVYGPGQQNMLVPSIIGKIKKREAITLAKNIGLYITPIFVDDLVRIICQLATQNITGKFEILNIAGNESLSLRGMAEQISTQLNLTLQAEITASEPVYLLGSNKKLRELISSSCIQTDFQNGIREVIKYESTAS